MIPFPLRIYLDITHSCNQRCIHCYNDEPSHSKEDMSLPDILSILSQMRDMGTEELIIAGGEPLLRADLMEILSFSRECSLMTTVITNGLSITESAARQLREFGVAVRVSIDGTLEETHDAVRGGGSYRKALQAITLLKSVEAVLSLHFTVHRRNVKEIDRLPSLCSSLGVKDVTIAVLKPAGRAMTHTGLLISPAMIAYVRTIAETLRHNSDITLKSHPERNWEGFGCPAGNTKLGIHANGDITPCVFLGSAFRGGNTRKAGLSHLWQHDKKLQLLRGLQAAGACTDCSDIEACSGGCRARALYYHNDICAPDPYCCSMKNAGLLLDSLNPEILAHSLKLS
ncbi:MAG: radical SAM/SPASM domain-containing protein [Candidatus Xenobiia bacterium LiM19]